MRPGRTWCSCISILFLVIMAVTFPREATWMVAGMSAVAWALLAVAYRPDR